MGNRTTKHASLHACSQVIKFNWIASTAVTIIAGNLYNNLLKLCRNLKVKWRLKVKPKHSAFIGVEAPLNKHIKCQPPTLKAQGVIHQILLRNKPKIQF